MKHLLSGVALAVLLAQPAGPGQWNSAAQAQSVSEQDLTFAEEAAKSGLLEVQLGELATKQADSSDVQDFGRRMVEDHGKANEQLKSIAEEKGITLPDNLDQDQQHTIDELSQLSGEEFDSAYMDQMVKDHENDVVAFREQVESGKDPGLRAFAEETLPTLEEHLNLAQQIDQELTVAPGDGRLDLAERHRNLLLRDSGPYFRAAAFAWGAPGRHARYSARSRASRMAAAIGHKPPPVVLIGAHELWDTPYRAC